jgi:hypothetical protein
LLFACIFRFAYVLLVQDAAYAGWLYGGLLQMLLQAPSNILLQQLTPVFTDTHHHCNSLPAATAAVLTLLPNTVRACRLGSQMQTRRNYI